MNIITIPSRHIRRKPLRYLMLLTIFTLGVISIVALYEAGQVIGENLEKKLTAYGANISISPRTETLKVNYGGFNLGEMFFDIQQLSESDTTKAIKSIGFQDRISIIAPKLISMTRVNNTPVAVIGVNWEQELAIKSYWAINGSYPTSDNEVLLGISAARALDVQPGDSLTIFEKHFKVSAVLYETGNDDDTVIFTNIAALQNLINQPDSVSFIEVAALCSGCPIDDIVAQLRDALPNADVKALQSVVNQRMASIKFVQKLTLIVGIIILVTSVFMVALSMLSAVNERRKDIGILRCLGFSKSKIFFIFCFEGSIIGCLAGLVGYLVGFLASIEILQFLVIADGISPTFSASHLGLTTLFFGFVTFTATLYPAWNAASTEPSETLTAF